MIKIFRNIRQKLLKEGKSATYLKYALGEITLVVIGILIALGINDWYDTSKNQEQLFSIYSAIEDDLLMDIQDIDSLIDEMELNEAHFLQVIDGKMTEEIYAACNKCLFIMAGFPDISMRQNAFKQLTEFISDEKAKQKDVIKAINTFYTYYETELKVDQQSVTDIFNARDAYWTKKYAWYSDYIFKKPNPDFIAYALNSFEYKNEASIFYLVFFKLYIPMLKSYKKDALKLIDKIHTEPTL